MFSNGMWALSSVLEANPDMADKIGFAPYPAYMPNSKPVVLSAEDSGYCISATTEHKEECIEFLNFLFSPENQKKYSEVAKLPAHLPMLMLSGHRKTSWRKLMLP